jgi:hypothetical protein
MLPDFDTLVSNSTHFTFNSPNRDDVDVLENMSAFVSKILFALRAPKQKRCFGVNVGHPSRIASFRGWRDAWDRVDLFLVAFV